MESKGFVKTGYLIYIYISKVGGRDCEQLIASFHFTDCLDKRT